MPNFHIAGLGSRLKKGKSAVDKEPIGETWYPSKSDCDSS